MRWTVRRGALCGETFVPGDKSIAHRALMLASLSPGRSTISGLPTGADVLATLACIQALGAETERDDHTITVRGGALHEPAADLYAANSGTTMRLMSGLLSGQPFFSRLTGDASLSRRPMGRVITPLTAMGAEIESADGHAPLAIRGARLHGIEYTLPVASAQVKSAILLAGMFASGVTAVREPVATRDHTERMLTAAGVIVQRSGEAICIAGGQRPAPFSVQIPGDASSAAFFLAGAAAGAAVTVRGVGLNPTRSALLDVLKRMGASVSVADVRESMGEPLGDVTVRGPAACAIEVAPEEVPLLIDELPLVALLATQADGRTVIRGAGELRVKESDRIAGTARLLQALGATVRELPDGFEVLGPTSLQGAVVHAGGDHRLAMLGAIAGTMAAGETVIEGAEAAAVSFPEFPERFRALGGELTVA